MDAISQQRLALVHPKLAEKIQQLDEVLREGGIIIRVTQGLRTFEEQDALYAQGRTTPGKIVTNVKGGESYHNYGLAVDCVPAIGGVDMRTYTPDWDVTHPSWQHMEMTGCALGLVSGACWKSLPDAPHFQMTGRFPVAEPNTELLRIFKTGGLKAVFAAV